MKPSIPPIYFYIPQWYWPCTIPTSADENWKGFGIGIYAWTLQTYLRLKAEGLECELVKELPAEGIVLVHRNSLRAHNNNLKPGANLLLICLKAELQPYPYAQLHIVQNPLESQSLKNSYYIPHWPQPALIPRNPKRDDRFENITFFGHEVNIASELLHSSWQKQLKALGLNWYPRLNRNHWSDYSKSNNRWNDYSEIDAIVAVRSFNQQELYLSRNYISKPATKLYNAWLANVPAILGGESAYRAERHSSLDYLEVASLADVISVIERLRDDRNLRLKMVQNGQVRAQAIQPSNITALWCKFLQEIAVPAYYHWRSKPRWSQQIYLKRSYLEFNVNRVQHKAAQSYRLISGHKISI
jgi:hypothetical protein